MSQHTSFHANPSHRWKVLGIGVAANASFSAVFQGIPTTAVFMRADYKLANTELGLVMGLLGLGIASILFAVALLASGVNSTVTATLAGQIVMEGFLRLRIPHWVRRLITRGIAIVPVVIAIALYGERGADNLLVFSQVILSIQLPFAAIPLVQFVSSRKKMGNFVIGPWISGLAWLVTAIILILNFKLLYDTMFGVG